MPYSLSEHARNAAIVAGFARASRHYVTVQFLLAGQALGMGEKRTCMFCDGRASTKEDAWPLWLVRMFPEPPGGVSVEAERKGTVLEPWRQRGHFMKIRYVCQSCNNGWMSALENEAKPLIQRLLSDGVVDLEKEREIIARWVLKTCMVFEAAGGSGWFYTKAERSTVREGTIPAGYTAFWAARCVDLSAIYCNAYNLFEGRVASTSGVHGHVTSMAFGTLALQTMTVRPSDAVRPGVAIRLDGVNEEPWPNAAPQLWPPIVAFQWPPTVGLAGELGVNAFSDRFRPSRAS